MNCGKCGAAVPDGAAFCPSCGSPLTETQAAPQAVPSAEVPPAPAQSTGYVPPAAQPAPVPFQVQGAANKERMVAGILAIVLGSLGIHKFYLGFTTPAIILLVVTIVGGIFTFGALSAVAGIIGLVEGVIYLTKTDEDFYQTYVVQKKQWF